MPTTVPPALLWATGPRQLIAWQLPAPIKHIHLMRQDSARVPKAQTASASVSV